MSSVRTDSESMAGRTGRLRIEPLEERILMSAAVLSAVGKISEGLIERDAERVRGGESRFPAERDRGSTRLRNLRRQALLSRSPRATFWSSTGIPWVSRTLRTRCVGRHC